MTHESDNIKNNDNNNNKNNENNDNIVTTHLKMKQWCIRCVGVLSTRTEINFSFMKLFQINVAEYLNDYLSLVDELIYQFSLPSHRYTIGLQWFVVELNLMFLVE